MAAVTKEGLLLTWGCNSHGQLGHGDTRNKFAPCVVQVLKRTRIVDVSCGKLHSACISDLGLPFTWGFGDSGALGHGISNRSELLPRMVERLVGLNVRKIMGYVII